jgi:hypothetical protein
MRLVEEQPCRRGEVPVPAELDDEPVEAMVRLSPGGAVLGLQGAVHRGDGGVEQRHLLRPRVPPRQPLRRLRLQAGEHLVDLPYVAGREGDDAQATRRARLQETFGLEADQRFPHGRAGGAERQGQLRLQHLGASCEAAIHDPGLDGLMQAVHEGWALGSVCG